MDAAKEEERHTRGVETGPFFFFFLFSFLNSSSVAILIFIYLSSNYTSRPAGEPGCGSSPHFFFFLLRFLGFHISPGGTMEAGERGFSHFFTLLSYLLGEPFMFKFRRGAYKWDEAEVEVRTERGT